MANTQFLNNDGYSIEELSRTSGVPIRTIRFYQGKRALPEPERRGRNAVYREHHLDRLKLISQLQDRGLSLKMIREVVTEQTAGNKSVADWLGVADEIIDGQAIDAAKVMTEAELNELLKSFDARTRKSLTDNGLIQPLGTRPQTYRVESPAQLNFTLNAISTGITVDGVIAFGGVFRTSLRQAAEALASELLTSKKNLFSQPIENKNCPAAYVNAMRTIAREGLPVVFFQELERALTERHPHASDAE